jgi:hypothetical protein
MKPRFNPFLCFAAASLTLAFTQVHAATNVWEGDEDNDFQNANNWTGDAFPDPAVDIMRFDGPGTQGNATITNVTVALANTGTSPGTNLGQILFSASAPAMTLEGGVISLPAGTHNNAIALSSGSAVTQTIDSDILIGDGTAATSSVVNSSTTEGGLLKFTGNITGGTGSGTPGTIAFSFGNTTTQNGNYEVTGNIAPGGATGEFITLTKRGSGILTLSGTNNLGNGAAGGFGQNEASSVIHITGGTTSLNNGADAHWGGNNVAGVGLSPVVRISSGTLNVTGARNIRNSLLINGGTLNIGAPGGTTGRLSFDAANANKTFEMSSGQLNYLNDANNGANQGVRFGNDNAPSQTGGYSFTGVQSGGTFVVYGRGGSTQTFSLGSASANTTSYTLSGGILDVRGSVAESVPQNNAFLALGTDAPVAPDPSLGSTTFTLSGTGKLIVRSNGTQGIVGSQAGATQVLDLQGGTLVAGRIDAVNLRGTAGGSNGSIVNNGTTISPGDAGFSGRTLIVNGGLTINSGKLAIDIGGTTANTTTWQDAPASGKFDRLTAGGNIILGGTLEVSLIDGYLPENSDAFAIVVASTGFGVSGTFTNLSGGRINLSGGASFAVTVDATSVILSDYQSGGGGGDDFSTWATDNGIAGEPFDGDFDNDGISNGVEYALGENPTTSSQPAGALSGNTITFTKGADAIANADVSWIIETSTTLAANSWTDEVTHPAGEDNGTTITYTFTPGTPAMKFARLKVVQVP